MRRYPRYGYRDVEELLAERGIEVDQVTGYRWMQMFTAEFIDAARPARVATGDRSFVDETYVKIGGQGTGSLYVGSISTAGAMAGDQYDATQMSILDSEK